MVECTRRGRQRRSTVEFDSLLDLRLFASLLTCCSYSRRVIQSKSEPPCSLTSATLHLPQPRHLAEQLRGRREGNKLQEALANSQLTSYYRHRCYHDKLQHFYARRGPHSRSQHPDSSAQLASSQPATDGSVMLLDSQCAMSLAPTSLSKLEPPCSATPPLPFFADSVARHRLSMSRSLGVEPTISSISKRWRGPDGGGSWTHPRLPKLRWLLKVSPR